MQNSGRSALLVRSAAETSFNSLFEMRHDHAATPHLLHRCKTFNSLFEMPYTPRRWRCRLARLSILYLRCHPDLMRRELNATGTFNSLFEMPSQWRLGSPTRRRDTFNSLFEMRYTQVRELPAVEVVALSILYLRCPPTQKAQDSKCDIELSILYLRCTPRRRDVCVGV